jgi:hypothetical protein
MSRWSKAFVVFDILATMYFAWYAANSELVLLGAAMAAMSFIDAIQGMNDWRSSDRNAALITQLETAVQRMTGRWRHSDSGRP